MTPLLFVAYVGACALAVYAQLVFTIRECRRLTQRGETAIDQLYVRIERYLGLSFRSKLEDWLQTVPWHQMAAGEQRVQHGNEQIVIKPDISVAPDSQVDDILVTNHFVCGARCQLGREIYVRGDCEIGQSSIVQALAVDGRVILRRAARVVRWLDAEGNVALEPGCEVRGRLTSTTSIALAAGSSVRSAYAPVVATARNGSTQPTPVPRDSRTTLSTGTLEGWAAVGADRHRIRLLAADCLEYDGDLTLAKATILPKLVVRGNLTIAAGSEVREDVKATGSVRIGANSVCWGNIVAGRDVQFGCLSMFAGVVYAERHVRFGEGVLGHARGRHVAVYACETVTLGHNVWLQGKVAAGRFVVAAR